MPATVTKGAGDIYAQQNKVLHRAFYSAALPYGENKTIWCGYIAQVVGRAVTGLSDLTLGERARVLNELQRRNGSRLYAPAVPAALRGWKKGDKAAETSFKKDDDPQVRMVTAMWAEMGYPEKTLRGLCRKMFRKDDPRWLTPRQLSHLVNVVQKKAESKKCGVYYR